MSNRKLILCVLVLACDSPTSVDAFGNVQTLRSSYAVEASSIGRRIVVDMRYTNTLPVAVHLGHCGGMPSILFKRDPTGWKVVGGSGALDCGGSTAIVNPGDTYQTTIFYEGAPRGSNMYPQFEIDDLGGEYRIVLMEVVVDRSDTQNGTLVHERYRTSNTFQVVE